MAPDYNLQAHGCDGKTSIHLSICGHDLQAKLKSKIEIKLPFQFIATYLKFTTVKECLSVQKVKDSFIAACLGSLIKSYFNVSIT